MKKADLIKAAEDLNKILGLDPPISIEGSTPKQIRASIKEGSLWLLASDSPDEITIEVLKELEWSEEDFADLSKEQDPLPLFRMHNIWMGGDGLPPEAPPETEPEEAPEPLKTDIVDIEEVPEELPEKEVKQATLKEKKKPSAKAKVPGERGTYRSSAYSTAIAIMNKTPTLNLQELTAEVMTMGFNAKTHGNSVKTAHSIHRKIYRGLGENGHTK